MLSFGTDPESCVTEYTLVCEEKYTVVRGGIVCKATCKREFKSHGARTAHQIITMMKWIRTSRLPIKKSLSWLGEQMGGEMGAGRACWDASGQTDVTSGGAS